MRETFNWDDPLAVAVLNAYHEGKDRNLRTVRQVTAKLCADVRHVSKTAVALKLRQVKYPDIESELRAISEQMMVLIKRQQELTELALNSSKKTEEDISAQVSIGFSNVLSEVLLLAGEDDTVYQFVNKRKTDNKIVFHCNTCTGKAATLVKYDSGRICAKGAHTADCTPKSREEIVCAQSIRKARWAAYNGIKPKESQAQGLIEARLNGCEGSYPDFSKQKNQLSRWYKKSKTFVPVPAEVEVDGDVVELDGEGLNCGCKQE